MSPLSRRRMRDRKRLDRVKPMSNLNLNQVVKPNRAKISELRDMMQDISDESHESQWIKAGYETTGWADDGVPQDIDILEDSILDADGNLIPDF